MAARIAHISYYLPSTEFTNDEFFKLFPELNGNANLEKIGVRKRVISAPGETASDMAVKAAKKLFDEHHINPADIDFLLYSSLDFDYKMPATSCVIHGELGLNFNCGTLDLSHGCSAYVYALSVAKGLIQSNGAKNVLLLTANTLTKDIHPRDKASRFVFGDAAAATLITASDLGGIQHCVFGTDSAGYQKIIVKDGGSRNPLNEKSFEEFSDEFGNTTSRAQFFMDGTGVFLFSLKRVPVLVAETLKKNNLAQEDIDLFIFHQANLYMIGTITKKLNIPPEKVFNNMQEIGNTVGSTIPIALAQALATGILKKNAKVMLIGFGVGLSLSSTVLYLD
ncbi:MAG TPA: ketoacyl-ACP synthase III [Flavobacteriales bacterium]|nr:ketoacyl-ACP synthase III [Flavobacteriales bacterium]